MDNFRLKTYLASNTDADKILLEQLLSHCTIKQFKKGDFLLRQGEKCSHAFFIESGLLRQFLIHSICSGKVVYVRQGKCLF